MAMNIIGPTRQGLGIGLAVATLAGCGQGQTVGTGMMPQSAATAGHVAHRKSWMLPEAKGQDLLYASDNGYDKVFVFSYPDGKLVGTLGGFYSPVGECVDKGGNVWITDGAPMYSHGVVYEFAHGGTNPIATLSVPYEFPYGCSIDVNTGNLAVTYGQSQISIFANAQGTPTTYSASSMDEMQYCGYDNRGNLFAVGVTGTWPYERNALAELPSGESNISVLSFNRNIDANVVQWDGAHLAVGGVARNKQPVYVYQVDVYGSNANIISTATLSNKRETTVWQQFWIQGDKVIQTADHMHNISIWGYPQGGKPTKTLKFGGGEIWGVVVSPAKT